MVFVGVVATYYLSVYLSNEFLQELIDTRLVLKNLINSTNAALS